MRYTTLPGTSIKISKICLGTMTWGQQNTEAEGHAQLDYAVDQGINFIDTAELYSVPAIFDAIIRSSLFFRFASQVPIIVSVLP